MCHEDAERRADRLMKKVEVAANNELNENKHSLWASLRGERQAVPIRINFGEGSGSIFGADKQKHFRQDWSTGHVPHLEECFYDQRNRPRPDALDHDHRPTGGLYWLYSAPPLAQRGYPCTVPRARLAVASGS
jgi:hypothetical protein